MWFRFPYVAVSVFIVAAAGCARTQKNVAHAPTPVVQGGPDPGKNAGKADTGPASSPGAAAAASFEPIYFDFDSHLIRGDAKPVLERLARYLKEHPTAVLIVGGHSDDRGTPEYNLALGDQRARAARQHLARLGVSPDRVHAVSYGEERPAIQGEGEDTWAKNRRDEFEFSESPPRAQR